LSQWSITQAEKTTGKKTWPMPTRLSIWFLCEDRHYHHGRQMFRFAQHDGLWWQGRLSVSMAITGMSLFFQGPAGPFWIPACAGMTKKKINRIHRPDYLVEDASQ